MFDPCCVILGGGGHARVVIDCLQAVGNINIHSILDPDHSRWGQELFGIPILGGDDKLRSLSKEGVTSFVVGTIGNREIRQKLFEIGLANGLEPLSVVHPTAVISRRAAIGVGLQALPASIINAGARVGNNVVINTRAVVEHDCEIHDHVHLATGAILAGGVQVERGAHIGAGATVRQGITIGEGAIVGIGAAVVKDVQPYTVVAGVPAVVLRKLKEN